MHEEKIKRLYNMKKMAEGGGGEDKIESQHSKGKLTEREKYYGDGVITGFGTINSRQVFVYAYDFTILGGSLGEMAGKKIVKVMDHAVKTGSPLIGILDSGGARIQEGVMSLDGYG